MTLRVKLILWAFAITLAAGIVAATNFVLYLDSRSSLADAAEQSIRNIREAQQAQFVVDRIHQTISEALFIDADVRDPHFAELDRQAVSFYGILDKIPGELPHELSEGRPVYEQFQAFYVFAKNALRLPRDAAPEIVREMKQGLLIRQGRLSTELASYFLHNTELVNRSLATAQEHVAMMTRLSVLLVVFGLLACAGLTVLATRSLVQPLAGLAASAQQIASGNLRHRVQPSGSLESRRLGAAFNAMADRLEAHEEQVVRHTAALEEAKAALEKDIEARKMAEERGRQLEAELRRSQTLEAVGCLAGGVAHDFNNLLGAILGCLSFPNVPDSPSGIEYEDVQRAKDLCRQGGELTRKLLAIASRKQTRPARIETVGLLEDLRIIIERTFPKNIRLEFHFDADTPPLLGDAAHLQAALLNLAINARDVMGHGGLLCIRCSGYASDDRSQWVRIEIEDTGPGVPKALVDRIFQPFFSTKEPGRGVGLGLAMAHAAIEECGGRISVDSPHGGGARFVVLLPAQGPSSGDVTLLASDRAGQVPEAGRILLVEDEPDVTRGMQAVLARVGYQTLHAASGVDALELLQANGDAFSLVSLDLITPGLDAGVTYRLLRQFAPNVPVMFSTGREDLAFEIDPEVPVLAKPFTDEELVRAVSSAIAAAARELPA